MVLKSRLLNRKSLCLSETYILIWKETDRQNKYMMTNKTWLRIMLIGNDRVAILYRAHRDNLSEKVKFG